MLNRLVLYFAVCLVAGFDIVVLFFVVCLVAGFDVALIARAILG